MIRYLTFKIVLHNRHNNFYALVTPKGTRDKENKEKTKIYTQQPSCSSYLKKRTENVREQNAIGQEKNYKMIPTPLSPHPHPNIKYSPPFPHPPPHHLSHLPINCNTIQRTWHSWYK